MREEEEEGSGCEESFACFAIRTNISFNTSSFNGPVFNVHNDQGLMEGERGHS